MDNASACEVRKEAGMIRWLRASGACGALLLVALVLDIHAAELSASEHCTIEALIQHVEHLTDAVFIRNNKAYTATTAAQFLRSKWGAALDEITTVQDFIAKVASVSSTTGQPYRIRFPDGHEVLSGDYLRTVLQQCAQPF
jgi:Family of unknown function (DUF5329)